MSYELSAETALGTGDWNAYQTVSNRYHTLGLRPNTAVGRAALTLTHDFSKNYRMTAVADALGSIHGDHKFYLQQLYVHGRLLDRAGTQQVARGLLRRSLRQVY